MNPRWKIGKYKDKIIVFILYYFNLVDALVIW